MNLSAPFIHRPVMTTVIMAALVLFGFFAYTRLPVSELPNVDFPTISVSASLPGAGPETMASTVATPLERQFTAIAGLQSMSSRSSTGSTRITLQFDLNRNIDAAAQDVQTAISEVSRQLPEDMPNLPTLRKRNPGDYSILYIAFTAKHLSMNKLDEYAETRVAQRLSSLPGVAQVDVWGSKKYATRIYINPYALNATGLSLAQVTGAIKAGNSNLPSGVMSGGQRYYTLKAEGQLTSAAQYNDLVLAYNNGAPVKLSDVGEAVDSVEQNKRNTTFNGQTAIVLSIHRQPGANTVEVAQAVRDLLPKLEKQAPAGAELRVIYDRSQFIKASIREVSFTLLLAMGLVIGVIFVFLRNASATLVSALALPTSLIGTFAFMYLLGFGLNNMSLLALTLAVGFVVDDAIVVQENIVRFMEAGHSRLEAAIRGSKEISFTVLSMTLSLVAVFIPTLFMGGVVGRLFTEFAITIAVAILLSGVVALTLTPMLSSRILRTTQSHGRLYQLSEQVFDSMRDKYIVGLRWSVTHWDKTLIFAAVILVLTLGAFFVIPQGFIPKQDSGAIFGNVRGPEGMAFEQMNAVQAKLADMVQHTKGVSGIMSAVGQGRGGTGNESTGYMMIGLDPHGERPGASEIIKQFRDGGRRFNNLELNFSEPRAINIGTGGSNSPYEYILQGSDLDELDKAAEALKVKAAQIPGIVDVDTDLELRSPQIDVHIDRGKAAALGVNPADIQTTLYSAFGGHKISTIYGPTNNFSVTMELAPQYQQDANALNALYVPGRNNTLVPLTSFAQVSQSVGPLSVNHYNELPAVTLSFNTLPGVSLGSVSDHLERLAASSLPADITASFAGNAQVFQESMRSLPILLMITILVIYMVLAILYEDFVHPFTILTALPLAIFGALIALLLTGQELDIFSFVGLILLVGLVKKNGIIMVDFALSARRADENMTAVDAIVSACNIRFRPIMMTTVAAILGTLPIAIGFGAGAEARRPLGITAVGGLLFSQFLTLFVTPAFYVAMDKLAQRTRRRGLLSESVPGREPHA